MLELPAVPGRIIRNRRIRKQRKMIKFTGCKDEL